MVLHDEFSSKFAHKLNAFYQLRSLFAPLIEGLISLDRLTFLRQQVNMSKICTVKLQSSEKAIIKKCVRPRTEYENMRDDDDL